MVAVILLAGGESRRLGRDKIDLRSGGRTLLDVVLSGIDSALGDRLDTIVVVGPTRNTAGAPRVAWTRESPAGGGPVAALAAGLEFLDTRAVASEPDAITCVLAGDAPGGPLALAALIGTLEDAPGRDAAILASGERRHYLCAAFRTSALRSRIATLPAAGESMRVLAEGLDVVEVPDRWGAAQDIDTPDDADRLGYS